MGILDDYFGVAGKIVLITGGSRGIGEAIAESFVEAGAEVYICSRSESACAETAARLSQKGFCVGVPADLSTDAGRKALATEMARRESKLDVLINNAGAIWAAPLAEYPETGWDKVFDLNVKGLFFVVQALAPLLEKPARMPIRRGSSTSVRSTVSTCPSTRPTLTRPRRRPCTTCRGISQTNWRPATSR